MYFILKYLDSYETKHAETKDVMEMCQNDFSTFPESYRNWKSSQGTLFNNTKNAVEVLSVTTWVVPGNPWTGINPPIIAAICEIVQKNCETKNKTRQNVGPRVMQ